MTNEDVKIPAAILSLLRGTDSVRGISERLGVTEAQVHQWKDIFVAAGVIALYEARHGFRHYAGALGSASVAGMPLPETTTEDPCTPEPTTVPPTTVAAEGVVAKSTVRGRRRR